MPAYVVTGPLALVKDQAGKVRYYYTGAQLPDDTSAEQLTRLTGRGLISQIAAPAAAVTEPDSPPADTTPPPGQQPPGPAADSNTSGPERPAQVATKAAWVEYAVSPPHSMERAKAEAMTKAELVAAFPPE